MQLTIYDAIQRGHAAAQRAARRAGDAWTDEVLNVLTGYLSRATVQEFTVEEVREAIAPLVAAPPDLRAWGNVTREAVRRGVITRVAGRFRAAKSSNGSPKPIYTKAA